jgi:hypothetical protein
MRGHEESKFISGMQKAFADIDKKPPDTKMSRVCVLFFKPTSDDEIMEAYVDGKDGFFFDYSIRY